MTPSRRSDGIAKECEPVPDKRYRNRDVIEDVESRNWLHGDRDYSRRRRRADTAGSQSEGPPSKGGGPSCACSFAGEQITGMVEQSKPVTISLSHAWPRDDSPPR
jgi:hypothetical protein